MINKNTNKFRTVEKKQKIHENSYCIHWLINGSTIQIEWTKAFELSDEEEKIASFLLEYEFFTPIEGISYWRNGDFYIDYPFETEEQERTGFALLKNMQNPPKWIQLCPSTDHLFCRIGQLKGEKWRMTVKERWVPFISIIAERLKKIKDLPKTA